MQSEMPGEVPPMNEACESAFAGCHPGTKKGASLHFTGAWQSQAR
jgi:hypothetical protein